MFRVGIYTEVIQLRLEMNKKKKTYETAQIESLKLTAPSLKQSLQIRCKYGGCVLVLHHFHTTIRVMEGKHRKAEEKR